MNAEELCKKMQEENFGKKSGGFDVYISTDLENWSEPVECFDSVKYNLNHDANRAPEVHKYKGVYYMFLYR